MEPPHSIHLIDPGGIICGYIKYGFHIMTAGIKSPSLGRGGNIIS